jgi:predicted secreted protein
MAQERPNPLIPADVTVLTLTESASRKVAQDRIRASLRLEERGGDPVRLQATLNDKMSRGLSTARRFNGVDVQTGGYSIYRINHHDQPAQWQASQSIELDSADATALLNVAGELQKAGFLSSGMTFYLSRDKAASLTDDLLEDALKKLTLRAQRMGKVLGKTNLQMAEVTHGSHAKALPILHRAEMMAADGMMARGAKPVADPGEQDVEVTLHAVIYLRP